MLHRLLFYYNTNIGHLHTFNKNDSLPLVSTNILQNNFHQLAHLIFSHFTDEKTEA